MCQEAVILTLPVIAEIIFLAVSSGAISLMLWEYWQPGMIFSPYGKWVESGKQWWKKPLGACVTCFNAWVTIWIFALWLIGAWFIVLPLAILAISNSTLRQIIK
jgi:hypothetical protein